MTRQHTATVLPYAGSVPEGLLYFAPVEIACNISGRRPAIVEADGSVADMCPLWSLLVLPDRTVRVIDVQLDPERACAVIETERLG